MKVKLWSQSLATTNVPRRRKTTELTSFKILDVSNIDQRIVMASRRTAAIIGIHR
jgi:hypothetical protein